MDRRPKYTGALGGAVSISQMIAPTLGGVLTDRLSWSKPNILFLSKCANLPRMVLLDQPPLRRRNRPHNPPLRLPSFTSKDSPNTSAIPLQIRPHRYFTPYSLDNYPPSSPPMGWHGLRLVILAYYPPPSTLRCLVHCLVYQPVPPRR